MTKQMPPARPSSVDPPALGGGDPDWPAGDSALVAEARRLRVVERLSVRQIQDRLGVGKDRLRRMLRGVPAPDWTKRPNAKDDLRARAVELRAQGRSVVDIAAVLGVARLTAYQWVRHLPLDRDVDAERARRQAHSRRMTDALWGEHRQTRDAAHGAAVTAAARWVGSIDDREVMLVGAAIYWCEGCKAKPWRPTDFRVSIHETAQVEAATRWWAELVGVAAEAFQRPNIKKHALSTRRRNVGDDYRGCLIIDVPRSRELYWRIEGIMRGMAGEDSGVGR
ncbi:helix-turn-helix domain-containing protein [Micromonospora zhanjiangensis]|uniref:Helix-turn-helix domain-containing protein n=1 Tax=Micromonospora zhanjiangensis TaxID=1522057 RepID=A0ABV8KFD2_9ACTN